LISSASAGAFIHGLEDEFMEVRYATIGTSKLLYQLNTYITFPILSPLDSICELSQYSEKLAVISAGPLVDMFNDEIHSVRDNAINSLRKIGKRVTFSEEEVLRT
jgi:integrator complex subunit 4